MNVEAEIMQYILRASKKCAALFEVPSMVYAQIVKDNAMRIKPIRANEKRISRIMHEMAAEGKLEED